MQLPKNHVQQGMPQSQGVHKGVTSPVVDTGSSTGSYTGSDVAKHVTATRVIKKDTINSLPNFTLSPPMGYLFT